MINPAINNLYAATFEGKSIKGGKTNLTPEAELQQYRCNPNDEPDGGQIAMMIDYKEIGCLEDFITVTGIEKAGKGIILAALAAAALKHEEIWGIKIRVPENRNRVALFDTEQSQRHFLKSMNNIKKIGEFDILPDCFDTYRLRGVDPKKIVTCIDTYIRNNPDCSILFLDGLLDLIGSFFNDTDKSDKLVRQIMEWPEKYNLFLIGVLHRSKVAGNTLGHFGSMANRKAQSVLLVEKSKETGNIILQAEYLRSAATFNPIEVYYDGSLHTWKQTYHVEEEEAARKVKRMILNPSELDMSDHRANVLRIFNSQELQDYKTLVQSVKEFYSTEKQVVNERWSKICIAHLREIGLIFKTEYGYSNKQQAKLYVQK